MRHRWISSVITLSIFFAATSAHAQPNQQEEARRHMVRGTAAVEMAKSPGDLADAVAEFQKAAELAPGMAAAWFNLGAVEAKLEHYANAIEAYRHYLQLSPKAANASSVQDTITKLEYQQERTARRDKLVGNWTAKITTDFYDGENFDIDNYKVTLNGNEFRMEPLSSYQWLRREFRLFTPDSFSGGKLVPLRNPKIDNPTLVFVGRIEGEKIIGERIRPGFYDAQSKCQVGDNRTPFEGRIENNGDTLVIAFDEPRYRAIWDMASIFSSPDDTKCLRVETDPPVRQELHLTHD